MSTKKPQAGAPKNFLVPVILLHLREFNAYGYELMEKLTSFGIDSLDRGNFYRILRQLEKDELVTSEWNTDENGPAKRVYAITEEGQQYLDLWAGSFDEYQKLITNFFKLYNPFLFTSSILSDQEKESDIADDTKE